MADAKPRLADPAERLRAWGAELRALAMGEIMCGQSRALARELADSLDDDAGVIDDRMRSLLALSDWQRAALHRLAAAKAAKPLARGVPRPRGVQGSTLEVLIALGGVEIVADTASPPNSPLYTPTADGWRAAAMLPVRAA